MLSLLLLLAPAAEPGVQIRPASDPTRVEVVATLAGKPTDLPQGELTQEQGERRLRLCLIDPDSRAEGPAMLGSYSCKDATLVFTPRRPLSHGQRYRAILDLGGSKSVKTEYRVPPRAPQPPAVVEAIYPSADVLPANQLKFYLHFSRPMREGKAIFDQLQILDENGKPLHDPWRRTELWSADSKRLTIWIHPGRIKRGVGPREDEGPVLVPGKKYRLVIPADLLDATGQPLGKAVTKSFRTIDEDRIRPLPEKWTLHAPRIGTRDALRVDFPEALDRALLDRFLVIKDERGRAIPGRIEVGKEERSWSFHPEKPWTGAEHRLVVDEDLEDLAGNTPARVFDTDLKEPPPTPPTLTLRFRRAARQRSSRPDLLPGLQHLAHHHLDVLLVDER